MAARLAEFSVPASPPISLLSSALHATRCVQRNALEEDLETQEGSERHSVVTEWHTAVGLAITVSGIDRPVGLFVCLFTLRYGWRFERAKSTRSY